MSPGFDRSHSDAFRPRKSLGQNFIIDAGVARKIVRAADLNRDDVVLEIGPGRGALTALLLQDSRRVVAVELDRRLVEWLRGQYDPARFELVEGDILELDWAAIPKDDSRGPDGRWVVVGNLPYNISKPLAMKLVDNRARVASAVLTLQREVADRLVAQPSTRAYGPMGILVGQAYEVVRVFDIAPSAFRPRPKVVSTVTRWLPRRDGPLTTNLERALRSCLAASFAHRRRTLFNNLRSALPGGDDPARTVLDAADLDGGLRAEAVPPAGYLRLARVWPSSTLL
jgi:16S rRNA (adenine1518-N6/adenine1519-N6)-dimethyltransferase